MFVAFGTPCTDKRFIYLVSFLNGFDGLRMVIYYERISSRISIKFIISPDKCNCQHPYGTHNLSEIALSSLIKDGSL